MSEKKVWLVTGASSGLGLATVKKLLEKGYRVAGTTRDRSLLENEIGDVGLENFLAVEMQVTEEASITAALEEIQKRFGRLDVTVNNAGYVVIGSIEELTADEIRQNFDVNVFGVMNVTRHVMKIYRAQNSGYFLNIASISGTATAPGQAIYSATKAAVIMLTEAIDSEGVDFNVRATAVCPGGFKTNFLSGRSAKFSEHKMSEYQTVRRYEEAYKSLNQNQGGDPAKAAEVFIKLAESENPPKRIYLGLDGYRAAESKLNADLQELERHKDISLSTGLDR